MILDERQASKLFDILVENGDMAAKTAVEKASFVKQLRRFNVLSFLLGRNRGIQVYKYLTTSASIVNIYIQNNRGIIDVFPRFEERAYTGELSPNAKNTLIEKLSEFSLSAPFETKAKLSQLL